MEIEIKVDIIEFPVPSIVFVRQPARAKEAGFKPPQEVPLHMLSDETLLRLCRNFVEGVYSTARKPYRDEPAVYDFLTIKEEAAPAPSAVSDGDDDIKI